MVDPLQAVTVTAVTLVKAVAMIGMGVAGALLAWSALGLMMPGLPDPTITRMGLEGLAFAASLAGFEFADWTGSKLQVSATKAVQQAELIRLQGQAAPSLG